MILSCVPALTFAADAPAGGISGMEEYLKYSESLTNDGYIGIPVDIYTYYGENTNSKTPVMLYVINTNTERIGTDDDYTIVNDLVVNKGFIVCVLDYKNNPKTVSPDLDWSVQGIRVKIDKGTYLNGASFYSGVSYVLPAGYNILYNDVYWSIDKHGSVGSLENIVEVWNNDFQYCKGGQEIKYQDGTTATVAETEAKSIYDCVKKDGTPVDLDLRLDIIYPTHPEKDVPVMCLTSSSETRVGSWTNATRPHLSGFLFDGYAGVVYDYAYIPMARNDHYGYFDGNPSGVSGDNYTYSLSVYNGIKSDSAAIRKIRYLSDIDHDTYSFDVNKFGVYGNSKGGLCTRLGEPNYEKLPEQRYFEGHQGETRYEAIHNLNQTDPYIDDENNNFNGEKIVDDPEPQPYLTYKDGTPIPSNVQFVYANCGGGADTITKDHAPTFTTGTMEEGGSYYNFYPSIIAACRANDIPCLALANPGVGHAFGYGMDRDYGIDVYNAFRIYANYYLKDDNAVCEYIDPVEGTENVDTNAKIEIKFTGPVSEEEIKKVTVKNTSTGDIAKGSWTSEFGRTSWYFKADNLEGGYTYTVNVPKNLKAENGKEIAAAKQASFKTKHEKLALADGSGKTLTSTDDKYVFAFDKAQTSGSTTVDVRFKVSNDAANTVEVYKVDEINENDLQQSVTGEKLGEAVLFGAGNYSADITDYVKNSDEDKIAVALKIKKTPGNFTVSHLTFDNETDGVSNAYGAAPGRYAGAYISSEMDHTTGSGKSMKVEYFKRNSQYKDQEGNLRGNYIANLNQVAYFDKSIKDGKLTSEDYGRRLHVSAKIYDTTSRRMRFNFNKHTVGKEQIDWRQRSSTITTTPNKWQTIGFDYWIDEELYCSDFQQKTLSLNAETKSMAYINDDGSVSITDESRNYPFYYDDVIVTEDITNADIESAYVVLHPADMNSLYPTDIAYVESGDKKDSVTDSADSVYVSGRSLSLSGSSKAYIKLSLDGYDGGSAGFSFETDEKSNGHVYVYGLKDKDDCENWSSETINYLNAPGNNRFDYSADENEMFNSGALEDFEISGKKTCGVDITDYASYMKSIGASSITLVLVNSNEADEAGYSENFESNIDTKRFFQGGSPVSRGKSSEQDHTTGSGSSYKFVSQFGYDRLKIDITDDGFENYDTPEKGAAIIGLKYKVSFWAMMSKAGTFAVGTMAQRAGTLVDGETRTVNEANKWQKFEYVLTMSEDADWASKLVSGQPATYTQMGLNAFLTIQSLPSKTTDNVSLYIDDISVEKIGSGNVNITPVEFNDGRTLVCKTDFNSNKEGKANANNVLADYNTTAGSFSVSGTESATVLKYTTEQNYSGDGGKSFLFSPNKAYNRVKFFNMFGHELTSEDVGKKYHITFMLKSDTAGSFSYGMMSKLSRKAEDKGSVNTYKVEEGTPDTVSYASTIYQPQKAAIGEADINKWKKYSYDITITEDMLSKKVNMYKNEDNSLLGTYNTGISLLGFVPTGFSDFTTQPKLYIDDISTYLIPQSESSETQTGFTYNQDFESVTNVSAIMGENGLEWQVLPGDTAKTKLDTYVLDSTEYYGGSKSLKLTSHYTYNKFKFKNTCDTFTEDDRGKEYQISFMAKASKAGSFGAGMSYSEGKYKDTFAQMVNFTVNPEDVDVWKRYVYKFTVGDEQLNDNAVWFSIIPNKMGQSAPKYRMGETAKGENASWKYIDSLDGKDPVYIYIDNFVSREVIPVNGTSLDISDKALISGETNTTSGSLSIAAKTSKDLPGIRKAYIHFAGGEYKYTQKATLFFDVTNGYEQTVKLYALKTSDYPNELTYTNAPASNEDESITEAAVYGEAPVKVIKLNGEGTYSADVTSFVVDHAPEDYIFVLVSEDISGKEYLNLDFETIKLTKDTDYKGYGAFNKAIDTSGGAAKVDAENPGDGIIILNAFGSGKTISAGENYKVSADVKNLSDTDKRFTVALANDTASYIAGENMVNIPSGQSANVQFEITAGAEDVQNGVCAAVIYSADGGAFEVDNVKIVSESAVEIDKNSVRLDVETAKENPQPIENTVSITLSTTGDSITVDGENVGASSVKDYAVGRTLMLSAVGEGTFMYWKDADSGLIVSYNKDYEFTVGSARKLIAIFAESGGAYVTFKNINGFVLAEGLASSLTVPKDPYVYGYEFAGWYVGNNEKTSLKAGDGINVSENTVYFAGFGKKETAYKITVNGEEKTYSYNDKVTVVADAEKDGKTFSYWKKDGIAASYDKEYSFYATAGSVLEAVYGENAENKNVLVMANPVMADETRIAFFAERNISSDCEIIETGILMGKAEGLTLESASIKAVAKSKAQNGQYTVRKKGVVSGETWYGRAYVIYRDSTGSAQIIYSNEVSKTVE